MSCYFIGCLHLGHNNIAKWRGFKDSEEHDDYLIKQWNSVINKRDMVWILGDVAMETSKYYFKLDLLNGDKKVVLGNHDKWQDVPELLKYVKGVSGMVDYKDYALTHSPIHPSEIGQYIGNIHAHIHHNNKLADMDVNRMYADKENNPIINTKGKYHNVDAYLLDFKPVTLESLNKQD
jgi:calcineurin-like phosphoesterase family protein